MHNTVQNLIYIEGLIKSTVNDNNIGSHKLPKIIAVSKTFEIDKIFPVIEYGHIDYGENKVQEAINKWTNIKIKYPNIKLHLIGKLQTNKVKFALKIFDYIHSLDTEKLAIKIADEQVKQGKRPKIFIQVNIGNESQKSGLSRKKIINFYKFCKNLNLDIIGTMCIPPNNENTKSYFSEMNKINKELNFEDLSMGMSGDYLDAVKNNATYLRIGSKIFGDRD
ncbi:YggS family pyridoxal phosphate-dependent enzyme [Candidatus Pelagibacter sp.]|jgi:PLP dependent protein|nr:YggS family pyridoxal phosphate-dependent enzyme [Candidatus Pelagibacter sp.]